jgi:hypothetical protein
MGVSQLEFRLGGMMNYPIELFNEFNKAEQYIILEYALKSIRKVKVSRLSDADLKLYCRLMETLQDFLEDEDERN